eukprot:Nitzschia sp. Nitz4//scaffold45_size130396//83117//84994//NITZ4_003461-RA/size130396-processed-gene-0.195-mRNA-1//1//CDS//3329552434//6534//frame0
MVSVRRAKKKIQVRNPYREQWEKQRIALLVGGLCLGLLLMSSLHGSTPAGDGSVTSSGSGVRLASNPFRNRKPHVHLTQEGEDVNMPLAGDQFKESPDNWVQRGAVKPKEIKLNERFNAMATDVLETLNCEQLFENAMKEIKTNSQFLDDGTFRGDQGLLDDFPRDTAQDEVRLVNKNFRRRLQENQHGDDGGFEINEEADNAAGDLDDEPNEKWGQEAAADIPNLGAGGEFMGMDDAPGEENWAADGEWDGAGYTYATMTAQHLFCLAATQDPPTELVQQINCRASGNKRQTLLNLWSDARSQIPDVNLLKSVLGGSREHKGEVIHSMTYDLWAPDNDSGLQYMVNTLNNELLDVMESLSASLGPDKLFVDVGSGLGLTTMAVAHKYPGTRIVGMEPASPNWLLQEMNLRCNLDKDHFKKVKLILAGVGPNSEDEDNMLAKLMWRPTATTSTRSWTPAAEQATGDVELLVRLRKLHSILAEADVYSPEIDVLNLDCQGCEYNLIPGLSEDEFDSIQNIMGGVHWGYIPALKLPSSERGRKTHERVCQHENIAKVTKECCCCRDEVVKANTPGEALYADTEKQRQATVGDVIDDALCFDFSTWAKDHYLDEVQDDWGWFELSSQA